MKQNLKSHKTRNAFVASLMAVILCVAMLVGTTFAWFTDSVTSGRNTITAGNLDIEVYHTNGNDTNEQVGVNTVLFDDVELWEPGAVEYENITIKNVGTLAAKVKMLLKDVAKNAMTTQYGGYDLTTAIKVAVKDGGFIGTVTRDTITGDSSLTWTTFAAFEKAFTLEPQGEQKYGIALYWQPTDSDNNWNLNNGKVSTDGQPLWIEFGLNVVATQQTAEEDSFDDQYDKDATYPILAPIIEDEAEVTVTQAGQAVTINNTAGQSTIKAASETGNIQIKTTDVEEKNNFAMAVNSKLERSIETTNSSADSVTYDISYTYTEGEQSYEVTEFAGVVTNVIKLSAGLKDVKVTHSHGDTTTNMTAVTGTSDANYGKDGYFYYNASNGELTIWSSKYSEFKISYATDSAAAVGGQGYATLQEAINAAAANDTITLLKDISLDTAPYDEGSAIYIDKSITLDLNKKGITVSAVQDVNNETNAMVIMNSTAEINVSIKNGTISTTAGAGCIMCRNNANVTLSDLTVTESGYNESSHQTNYRYAALCATQGANVTIESGTYTGEYHAAMVKANSTLTIKDGTYKCTKTSEIDFSANTNAQTICNDYGCIDIQGGTFDVADGDANGQAVRSYYTSMVSRISGGTFNGGMLELYADSSNVGMEISGGTFNKTIYLSEGNHLGFYKITGGTFVDDLTDLTGSRVNTTIPEGYIAEKDASADKWSVVPLSAENAEVSINDGTTTSYMMLKGFRDSVNAGTSYAGKTVTLLKDVDLSGVDNWTPIGTSSNPFSGVFDGNGKTISGLKVTASGTDGSGLFGYIKGSKNGELSKAALFTDGTFNEALVKESDYDCVVKNLNISGATISLGSGNIRYVAAAIGIAEKAYVKNVKVLGTSTINVYKYGAGIVALTKTAVIDGCSTASTVTVNGADTSDNTDGGGHTAGIVAYDNANPVVIMNCTNGAAVSGKYGYVGGILAYAGGNENGNATIYNCVNNGNIKVQVSAQFVAGIVGNGQGAPYILYCTNNGNVSGNTRNDAGTDNISGISSYFVGKIYSCINNGNLYGSSSYIGGLVGKTTSGSIEVSNSSNTGTISNTKEGGKTGDLIACADHGTTISNQTFADVAALQEAIGSVSGTLTLKNLTVTDQTGTLILPSAINNLISDVQYFAGLNISQCSAAYVTVTIPNFNYKLHGDASDKTLGLSGANNKTTFASDCKLNWLRNYGSNGQYVKEEGCVVNTIHGATEVK